MVESGLLALAGMLVGLGLFYLRRVSHSQEVLAWSLAWVSLCAAGIASGLPDASNITVGLAQVFGTLFPALLFVGAVAFRQGRVPWWALGVALGVGALRAGLTAADVRQASMLLSVPIKVAFIVGAARVVWLPRGAVAPGIAERLLGPLLLLLAVVDGVDPLVRLGVVSIGSYSMLPTWLVVGTGVGTMQLGTIVGRNQHLDRQLTRSRETLRESEARNKALVDAIPDVLVRLSRDLEILDVSAPSEDLLIASPECMIGRTLHDAGFAAEHVDAALEIVANVLDSGLIHSVEVPFPVAKGLRHFEVRVAPAGENEALLVARDISAAKRAEEEREKLESKVQQAQKLESLGVLTGGIAHDFNNLLVGILGNADLAQRELAADAPAHNLIMQVHRAATRAADLIKELLVYAGGAAVDKEAVDLNRVVEEMAAFLRSSISKKATLTHDFADRLPAIEANATQIRQIVMNLITNASEAIGDGSGAICFSTGTRACGRAYLNQTYLGGECTEGVYVYLEVSDSGCGMDAETARKIFDPFFTTKFAGRGLGLAALLGIVRGHGGAVKVETELGRGTTIEVLLPALDQLASRAERKPAQTMVWHGSGTVLLVDDEAMVRSVGTRMLERSGFSVVTAGDGHEAIEIFRQHREEIVCILLDYTMPGLDGVETLHELRRIRGGVPVILSSGYSEQEVVDRIVNEREVALLTKPYTSSKLMSTMRELLAPVDA